MQTGKRKESRPVGFVLFVLFSLNSAFEKGALDDVILYMFLFFY